MLRDQHEVTIRLGANYPRMMPELSWKSPIFHPNISGSGVVCLGGYGTYWVPSLNLDELCEMLWKNFGEPYPKVSIYRRPLSAMLNPIIKAGFSLDILSEPKPLPEFEQSSPDDYARWMREPSLLCLRVVKK